MVSIEQGPFWSRMGTWLHRKFYSRLSLMAHAAICDVPCTHRGPAPSTSITSTSITGGHLGRQEIGIADWLLGSSS